MPKTSVHKDDLAQSRKHKVGTSGQVLSAQSKSITHSVGTAPNQQLRRCIAALHQAHDSAALFTALLHLRRLIFKLGSVSNSSTTSLYRSTKSVTAVLRPSAPNFASSYRLSATNCSISKISILSPRP